MLIRNMNISDFDKVREIDAAAFSRGFLRTEENILWSFQLNPKGCFVAEDKESIVGYIFSRIWGNVSWIGTFGIDPDYKGKGVGKALLEKTIKYLSSTSCSIIGLETMGDSVYNIGMYTKCGLKLITPTLALKKEIHNQCYLEVPYEEDVDFEKISYLSNSILKGLDYKKEAESALKDKWGKVIFFHKKDCFGFAIIRTVSVTTKETDSLYVPVLAINTKSEELFNEALSKIENFAAKNGYKEVMLRANTANSEAVQWLMRR